MERHTNFYPPYYHAACSALIRDDDTTRDILARAIRSYRRAGDKEGARKLYYHAFWVGFPSKKRPNGRWS